MFIGYVRITDLGIARVWKPDNASDTSGTPGYMGTYINFLIFSKIIIYKNIFIYKQPQK